MTMIIVSGGIDLSVGATIALTGVITALGIARGWPPLARRRSPPWSTGGVIGIVNGADDHAPAVVPFIVTLGMLGIARGVAKWLAHEQTVNVPATWVNDLLVTFPKPAWLLVAPACGSRWLLAVARGDRAAAAPSSADASSRSAPTRRRRAPAASQTDRLKIAIYGLAGLPVRPAGRDADVAPASGRPDGRHRRGARHHRRRRDRRRKPQRRRGEHRRLDDRRADHGRSCATAASRWDGRTTSRRSSSA